MIGMGRYENLPFVGLEVDARLRIVRTWDLRRRMGPYSLRFITLPRLAIAATTLWRMLRRFVRIATGLHILASIEATLPSGCVKRWFRPTLISSESIGWIFSAVCRFYPLGHFVGCDSVVRYIRCKRILRA